MNDFTIRVIDLGAVITSGDARARTACPAGRAQMAWPAARTTTLSLADAGTTVLRAGLGDDSLSGGDATCGPGYDIVRPVESGDVIELDCEIARFSMPTRHPDAKPIDVTPYPELLDGDSVTFGMTCPYTEIDGSIFEILSISGTVVLRDPQDGRRLGGGSIPDAVTQRCAQAEPDPHAPPRIQIRVPLNARGRTLRAGLGFLLATVSFAGRNVPPVPWTATLQNAA
jgi:hypothetical protein